MPLSKIRVEMFLGRLEYFAEMDVVQRRVPGIDDRSDSWRCPVESKQCAKRGAVKWQMTLNNGSDGSYGREADGSGGCGRSGSAARKMASGKEWQIPSLSESSKPVLRASRRNRLCCRVRSRTRELERTSLVVTGQQASLIAKNSLPELRCVGSVAYQICK